MSLRGCTLFLCLPNVLYRARVRGRNPVWFKSLLVFCVDEGRLALGHPFRGKLNFGGIKIILDGKARDWIALLPTNSMTKSLISVAHFPIRPMASGFLKMLLLTFLSVATKNNVLNLVPSNSTRNACWYLLTCHLFLNRHLL